MPKELRWPVMRQCLCISLIILLVLAGCSWILYSNNQKNVTKKAITKARARVSSAVHLMGFELENMASDLRFLSKMHESADVFKEGMGADLAYNLLSFTLDKKAYDQIRYLDKKGMEIFRINYNGGNPDVVRKKDLQFKGDRYYFKASNKLKVGGMYISPLDLNKERGKVELPHKPILRVASSLFDVFGHRRGMVILNYFGNRLLRILDQAQSDDGGQLFLLNEKGYWLQGPKDVEWGFMFADKKNRTFQAKYPEEWKSIATRGQGVLVTDKGLFVYGTVNPGDLLSEHIGSRVVSQAGAWHVVDFVPHEALMVSSVAYAKRLATLLIPLSLVLMVGAFLACAQRQSNLAARADMIEQQESYARFVPKEFLNLLGKGNYRELGLDSHASHELTVLFSDIRSYTKLSEGMTHKEVIDFLNDYFVSVNTAIKDNNGFVDSFHGDALMALFHGCASCAVRASIGMHQGLKEFNVKQAAEGKKEVAAGMGLHLGEVTLGSLGTNERMQATVIGDVVNLAARIESSTKVFGVDIVISDTVYNKLPNPDEFHIREIDMVRVKGKQVPVALYEVFDTNPEEVRDAKIKAQPVFAEAMKLYREGVFEEAADKFQESLEICPEDTISPIFIKRCKTMMRIPPGDGWTGISTL